MNKLVCAFALMGLVATGAAFGDEKKAEPAACCAPKCDMKDGSCATHKAKKCAKNCAAPCCKPAKKHEHPKGEHPKGEHPKGDHPNG